MTRRTPLLRRLILAAGLGLAVVPSAASACLPLLPGERLPTSEEILRAGVERSPHVLYGVVIRGSDAAGAVLFRVLHVYKGSLQPGAVITLKPGDGYEPRLCYIATPEYSIPRGEYGVVFARTAANTYDFIAPNDVEMLLREGLLQSARGGGEAAPTRWRGRTIPPAP